MLTSGTALHSYQRLYAAFGGQGWWPASSRLEMVVGAILTQQSTWRATESVIRRLQARRTLTANRLLSASQPALERLMRPTGYFRQKAARLKHVVRALTVRYGRRIERLQHEHPDDLRSHLLSIRGIGEETADDIMLYAANRPTLVLDAYTVRIVRRLGWVKPGDSRASIRASISRVLPPDAQLLNEFHALLVELGKRFCRATPACASCPLRKECRHATGRSHAAHRREPHARRN